MNSYKKIIIPLTFSLILLLIRVLLTGQLTYAFLACNLLRYGERASGTPPVTDEWRAD